MSYDFELTCALPATPEAVYDAWLDSAAHSAMTGGAAKASKRDRRGLFGLGRLHHRPERRTRRRAARSSRPGGPAEFPDDDPDSDDHR